MFKSAEKKIEFKLKIIVIHENLVFQPIQIPWCRQNFEIFT